MNITGNTDGIEGKLCSLVSPSCDQPTFNMADMFI